MKDLSMKKNKQTVLIGRRGFTLVEILVVIGIIGLLSTFAIVYFRGGTVKARDAKRMSDLNQIGQFLSFGWIVPTSGVGDYDLNELIEEYKIKYPQYSNVVPKNLRDPLVGTDLESYYRYVVESNKKCAIYANLENEEEVITINSISEVTPGGGKGVFESSTLGANNTNRFFQVSS